MRIAVPVDKNVANTTVCASFGRAPYFLIYDSDTRQNVFLKNPALRTQGGAGVQSSQIVVDEGVDTAIVPRLGHNAAQVLQTAGVRLLQSENGTAAANLDACFANTLETLESFHGGFHRH